MVMVQFNYEGYRESGEKVTGKIISENQEIAIVKLKKEGILPVQLTDDIAGGVKFEKLFLIGRSDRIKSDDLELFWSKIALLLKHGVRINQALKAIYKGTPEGGMKKRIAKVNELVRQGETFSSTLVQWDDIQSPLYRSLVKVGELSGTMEVVAKAIADDLSFNKELQKKIEQALIYPSAVMFACLASILFIYNFVVPQFADLFTNMKSVPIYTVVMLKTGEIVRVWQWWIGLAVVMLVVGAKTGFLDKQLKFIGAKAKAGLQKLPGAKLIFETLDNLRFASVMALMLSQGVRINEALGEASESMSNWRRRRVIGNVRNQVRNGAGLAQSLGKEELFDESFISIIEAGERTGSLAQVFIEIKERLRGDYEASIHKLVTLMEPLIVMIMGVVVGGIVIVMLLSILSVNEGIM